MIGQWDSDNHVERCAEFSACIRARGSAALRKRRNEELYEESFIDGCSGSGFGRQRLRAEGRCEQLDCAGIDKLHDHDQ
jgi:hypothetical protein